MDAMLADPLAVLVLAHADDKLLLGHVQSDWTGLGPLLEEDIAASAMSQDDLSHALILYEFLGKRFDLDPDVIAFERAPEDYACCDLVTFPDEFDWATSLVKRWLVAVFTGLGLERLGTLDDADLSARCDRIMPEQRLQVAHLGNWIRRLGSAGGESTARMQAAVDRVAEVTGTLFEVPGHRLEEDETYCCGRDDLFTEWNGIVQATLAEAGLTGTFTLPERSTVGGRRGTHAGHFTEQLTEMTEVRRVSPGASW
ncbi:MAG: phenylacetate-CoA oxygenase subunit PaaC [Phycisphaerales bacterium]|nr:phenylacetate-CoA oxygenase subunit PaaC [Phycisphaerales bacterium]